MLCVSVCWGRGGAFGWLESCNCGWSGRRRRVLRARVRACTHGSDLQSADCSSASSRQRGLEENWGISWASTAQNRMREPRGSGHTTPLRTHAQTAGKPNGDSNRTKSVGDRGRQQPPVLLDGVDVEEARAHTQPPPPSTPPLLRYDGAAAERRYCWACSRPARPSLPPYKGRRGSAAGAHQHRHAARAAAGAVMLTHSTHACAAGTVIMYQ